MAFTEEELTQAIEKVVQTSIRVQYGSLGNRRIDLVFDDLRNAASGVFLSEANAVFYVVALAIAKVQKLLESERVDIGNLLEAITGVGRSISPVSNLSPLANARAALEALESASGSRTSSFGSIVDITAFQRFDDNTQRFLDESGKNIREAGDTARTPNESRLLLSSIQRELKDAHTEVLRRIALIAGAVSDYSAMNLPGLLSASVISKSRQVLDAHYDELAALPENDRLEKIREVTLDILAARAVVKGFGSLSSRRPSSSSTRGAPRPSPTLLTRQPQPRSSRTSTALIPSSRGRTTSTSPSMAVAPSPSPSSRASWRPSRGPSGSPSTSPRERGTTSSGSPW